MHRHPAAPAARRRRGGGRRGEAGGTVRRPRRRPARAQYLLGERFTVADLNVAAVLS
ncbi:MAG: hypothetical protein U0802_03905 [Candidatus Binatia bacterium]